MHNYIVLGIFLLSSLYMRSISGYRTSDFKKISKRKNGTEFDVLIFVQRWPLTACFVWMENSESHSCLLPKYKEWTIHGIWPTKNSTIGPEYCDRSLPFNASALAPIKKKLKENWIDIQNGSKPNVFWKHEWDKHGTCAVAIKALNNELKYFKEGLKLLDIYNMTEILAKENIIPGKTYRIDKMLAAVEKGLGKKGQIMCVKDQKTGESYVVEIRICFDKLLQLTNCDGIYNFPTNCDKNQQIIYPSYVPLHVPYYHVTQI